jgi:hypothetical protein
VAVKSDGGRGGVRYGTLFVLRTLTFPQNLTTVRRTIGNRYLQLPRLPVAAGPNLHARLR